MFFFCICIFLYYAFIISDRALYKSQSLAESLETFFMILFYVLWWKDWAVKYPRDTIRQVLSDILDNVSFKKTCFHAVYYIGTMPQFVRAKTCFFGIILCIWEKKVPKSIFLSFNCNGSLYIYPRSTYSLTH